MRNTKVELQFKSDKGITLIALVITIIVLLILAGVAILMLSGENGILNKAAKVKQETKDAETEETLKLAVLSALATGNGNLQSKDTLDNLKDELKDLGVEIEEIINLPIKITREDKEYIIEENGNVIKTTTIAKLKESGMPVEKKTTIIEDDGDRITIPKKFKVARDSGDTIEEGIVVISTDGSEFVWVPVPDVIYDGTTEIKVGKKETVGIYTPMARLQNGKTDYQGIFYDLDKIQGSQTVYDLATNGVGTINYREPSLITGNSDDGYGNIDNIAGDKYDNGRNPLTGKMYYELAGYNSIQEFGKDMQNEYNNMIKSVDKYKGFYVGRYETGIESGKAVSKNAYINNTVTTADASQDTTKYWYGLYNKQRKMAEENGLSGVESSMIWGSQYDAMMNWMIKTGNIVGQECSIQKWCSGVKITGQAERDIINKVHDLNGCHSEWTLQAKGNNARIARGGDYVNFYNPSSVNYRSPIENMEYLNRSYGSRITLYIE